MFRSKYQSFVNLKSALALLFCAMILPIQFDLKAADEDNRRAEEISFFETRIRPVLENSCKACHGPKISESDLRTDSAAGLKQGGAVHGPAIVPGKPDESPLFQAITYKVEDLKMPPKPGPLKPEVVADFRRWIERGAVWPEESQKVDSIKRFDMADRKSKLPWLWKSPVKPEMPSVKKTDWATSEVDKFLLAGIEKAGLKPAPDTDEITWLRRVNFVITGLPPTTAEVAAFTAGHSPNKREVVVDRLLANPAYGERWARHWMDLVRYAESRGHEGDYNIANAWRYRDYLIQAFNDDVPYDQFVREHLAGDLVDQPRYDKKTGANLSVLGTGWPFLGEEVHSPVDIRQDETDRLDNKIDVLGKTFLGLTIACARCHDHKFDAISQKDYYAMAGFFQGSNYRQVPFKTMQADREIGRQLQNLRELKSDQIRGILAASKPVSSDAIAKAIKSVDTTDLGKVLNKIRAEAKKDPGHPLHVWTRLAEGKTDSERIAIANQIAGEIQSQIAQPSRTNIKQTILDFPKGQNGGWAVDGPAFGAGPLKSGTVRPPLAANQDFVTVQQQPSAVVDLLFAKPRNDPQSEGEAGSLSNWLRGSGTGRTQKFTVQTGQLQYLVKGHVKVFACVASHFMLTGPLHGRVIMDLKVDGDQPQWIRQDLSEYIGQRVVIEVTPLANKTGEILAICETETPELLKSNPLKYPADMQLVDQVKSHPSDQTFSNWLERQLVDNIPAFHPKSVPTALQSRWIGLIGQNLLLVNDLQSKLQALLNGWFAEEQKIGSQIQPQSPTAPALVDLNPIDENVLIRGGWKRPGVVAHRNIPDAFGTNISLSNSGSGRLELAQSLTRPDQPLVGRVWVNRLWQHVFGRGIVPTPDNFGILGQRPSNPELLDYLAVTFTGDDRWSTKTALKRLVLSRTFSMTSKMQDSATETADPENILLHRSNLHRIEAEAIRDSILAVSGRLDKTLYGPGIPVHLTDFIVGRGRPGNSGPLDGAGRRSIYTTVRRNFLPTLLTVFDLPTPFSTVGRRNATNVPAQSLALANDPFVIDQARFWAERELREQPALSDSQRIQKMFQEAFARSPRADEQTALIEALSEYRKIRSGQDQAKSNRESWADLAHTLFSLNEFIYLP